MLIFKTFVIFSDFILPLIVLATYFYHKYFPMRRMTFFLLSLSIGTAIWAQNTLGNLNGGWQYSQDSLTHHLILADGYYMQASYLTASNKFKAASGGKVSVQAKALQFEVEFNSENPNDAGNFHVMDMTFSGKVLKLTHHGETVNWQQTDAGKPGQLMGAWLFSGRQRSETDTLQPYTPGVRKTMKILSGTRFQWAAYNTQTREFLGTGGGTYTTVNGTYTEKIDFFSRDNSRVGAMLSFAMQVAEPHWNHSGKSSKGDPIFERWSRRAIFE